MAGAVSLASTLSVGGATNLLSTVTVAGAAQFGSTVTVVGEATFKARTLAATNTDTDNTGSVTLDFSANQNFILTLTGNLTLANPSTESVGQSGIIVFIQPGSGGPHTLAIESDYETAGDAGITLSTAANAVDIIPYFVQSAGNILLGAIQKAFS